MPGRRGQAGRVCQRRLWRGLLGVVKKRVDERAGPVAARAVNDQIRLLINGKKAEVVLVHHIQRDVLRLRLLQAHCEA